MLPTFSAAEPSAEPFPHVRFPGMLKPEDAARALDWLKARGPWALRVEDFYEQHEFSLLSADLGGAEDLVAPAFIEAVRDELQARFGVAGELALVDVSAHRLTSGQTIRIHNDYLDAGKETHRLLIQLNDGWSAEQGGLLMLFAGDAPESLRRIVMPTHASGFAFEISPRSFHAVSSVRSGERYTLVYTYRRTTSP